MGQKGIEIKEDAGRVLLPPFLSLLEIKKGHSAKIKEGR